MTNCYVNWLYIYIFVCVYVCSSMGKRKNWKGKALEDGPTKKEALAIEWCEGCECDVPINPNHLAQHYNSNKHKR